jgi:DnaA family protein
MRAQQQLTLNVQLRDDATLDNFLAPDIAQAALSAVRDQLGPGGEPLIYLYGPPDTGKSHLLQASCHIAGSTPVMYLPLSDLVSYSPDEVLQGVEAMGLVCLDDIHAVMGNAAWEEALFHLFNRAREQDCRLLVSAHCSPRSLHMDLADLRSRLSWGCVFQLHALDDAGRQSILRFRAQKRGLDLPLEVASFISDRGPRTLVDLLDLLDQLDNASLVEKRALSIPFVKKALNW